MVGKTVDWAKSLSSAAVLLWTSGEAGVPAPPGFCFQPLSSSPAQKQSPVGFSRASVLLTEVGFHASHGFLQTQEIFWEKLSERGTKSLSTAQQF